MSDIVIRQAEKLASALSIEGSGAELVATLKATAFKGNVSDAQMAALLIVAQQYGLSPWTREIYAFPDKNNGIVPVVGVDGWARIINTHPQFDGMDFEHDVGECTCVIYRKDRSHPIRVTEYMAECERPTGPWKSHPRRMLRHKAMIQCARLAFGYGGIYDQDEAERIVESEVRDMGPAEVVSKPAPAALPDYTDEQLQANVDAWRNAIDAGKATPDRIINMVSSKYTLNEKQKQAIRNLEAWDMEQPEEQEAENG